MNYSILHHKNLLIYDELEGLLEVIKQSENYFRQIADQTPFIIWQVNSKGRGYIHEQAMA